MAFATAFNAPGSWYRGNLHGHTTESDGALTPAEYAAYYRGRGYDFVAVTDHWKRTDMSAFEVPGLFSWIPGVEVDGRDEPSGMYHVLGLGLDAVPPRETAHSLQATVDGIHARGGLAFVAHPYWSGQGSEQLSTAERYAGVEVYNGTCDVRWGKGVARAQWDELLQRGRDVLALATDDAHHQVGQGDDLGLGWVMVRAEVLTRAALLASLSAGRFYASTGPEILDFRVEPDPEGRHAPLATVRCSPCRQVHFLSDGPLGRTVNGADGEELTSASLRLHRAATYVRIECVDRLGRTAFGMPLRLRR